MTAPDHPHPLADAAYVQLTTFRRTGAPVPTPVWVAPAVDGTDDLVVITLDDTGKTRRLAHSQRVELRRCDVRGRVADDAPTYVGEGRVVRGDDEVAVVRRSVVAKYGWPARVSLVVDPVARLLHVRRAPRAGIRLAVETAPVSVGDATG
jgi:PPOX class probable F420-dependent enzyme